MGYVDRVSAVLRKHHDQKQLGEERVYFLLQLSGHIPPLTEVRAGTQAEAVEECFVLACSPWISQPAFLHSSDHLSRVGTAHSALGSHQSLNEKMLNRLASRLF